MAGALGGNAVTNYVPNQGNLYSGSNMAAVAAPDMPETDDLSGLHAGTAAIRAGSMGGAMAGNPATPPGVTGQPGLQGPTLQNQNTGAFDTTTHINAGPEYDQRVIDAYYGQQKSRLDPQWQQTQQNTDTQLANMGLSRGSEAWNQEEDRLSRQKNDAYSTALNSAIMAGGAEATRQQNEEIARQKAWNDAQAAQQAAAQGWESFITSRKNAGKAAGATMHAADASAAASRYATENASQLGNRSYDLNERQQDFDQALRMEQDPYIMQNLKMGGMYPTSDPTFADYKGGSIPGADQSNYAAQINAGNTRAAGGINDALGAAAGAFGGYMVNRSTPSPYQYDANYNGAGAPRGSG